MHYMASFGYCHATAPLMPALKAAITSDMSMTLMLSPFSFAAWPKLSLHHGQDETRTSAPTSLTSSNRCLAEEFAEIGIGFQCAATR